MNIASIGTNQYTLEGMTENELRPGSWRNLAGAEKVRNGHLVNGKGDRNITLFIPDENLQFFIDNGAKIKEYGGDPETGEPAEHFVQMKCNTETSKRPPEIQVRKKSGRVETLNPDSYGRIDGMTIKSADAIISFYHYKGNPQATIYLNFLGVEPYLNPIQEKWANMEEIADASDMADPEDYMM